MEEIFRVLWVVLCEYVFEINVKIIYEKLWLFGLIVVRYFVIFVILKN